MKRIAVLTLLLMVALLAVSSGCTGNAPASPPVTTIMPVTSPPTLEPVPTPDPFPDALALNTPVPFGTGTKTGEFTVTGYTERPTYNWVDPSWNSPREQAESSNQFETQKGYNTKKPQDGNTFLFVYVTAACTGTGSVWAPSPGQIVVVSDGKTSTYSTLASDQTIVDGENGEQYDFQFGTGGTGGYVQPGKSNDVKGFLIYEVPASFLPDQTYVLANLDAATQGVWKLG